MESASASMEGAILLCVIAGQFFLDYTVSLKRTRREDASAAPAQGERA